MRIVRTHLSHHPSKCSCSLYGVLVWYSAYDLWRRMYRVADVTWCAHCPLDIMWPLLCIRCTPHSGLIVISNHSQSSNMTIYHLWHVVWWILECHDWLEVDEGLWSISSRFPVVNSLSFKFAGQTQPHICQLLYWLLPCTVATLCHMTLTVLSQISCQWDPVCVFCCGWAGRDTMDEVSRSRLCLTATESALLRLMALNTSSCYVAAGLILSHKWSVLYLTHIKSFLPMQQEM